MMPAADAAFFQTYQPVPDACTHAQDTSENLACGSDSEQNSSTCSIILLYLRAFFSCTVGVYLLCILLDLIAYYCKLVILYWSALLLCVITTVYCGRCSSLVLVLQILYGIVLYMYIWNYAGFWHRPHYRPSNTWPWAPRL